MHHTLRSARPAAVLALALAAALVAPGTAFAGTTEPTPVTTTPVGSTTTSSTPSTTTSTTTTTSSSSTSTGTGTQSSTSSTTGTPSTTSSTTATPNTTTGAAKSPTTTKAKAAPQAGPVAQRPFGASQHAAARIAAPSSAQAEYAAGFIVRTLAARGDHYNFPASTFFDGGNTIDAILAIDGAKAGLNGADAATDYLAAHVDDYVGGGGETYAGPLGKLVVGVVAQGGDPADFGGQDLVTRLQDLMAADGRFSDASAFGDFSNTIGQALDLIALGRATGTVPDVAGDYLLDQQCTDGGFRGNLDVAGAACTTDADATAFAAQALVGLLGPDDPATLDALDWLASHQSANGGFLNQDGQYNANTAGVAAQAFAAGGYTAELALAQDFLASLQLDCTFATGLRGGIAFTAADYATLKATPGDTAALDRALRATPQSTLGLAGGSLLTVSAEDVAATAPTLSCATTTTTSTTAAPSTTTPPAVDPASAAPGELALTGSNVAALSLLGAMLLLAGVGALVLARRKGVHA